MMMLWWNGEYGEDSCWGDGDGQHSNATFVFLATLASEGVCNTCSTSNGIWLTHSAWWRAMILIWSEKIMVMKGICYFTYRSDFWRDFMRPKAKWNCHVNHRLESHNWRVSGTGLYLPSRGRGVACARVWWTPAIGIQWQHLVDQRLSLEACNDCDGVSTGGQVGQLRGCQENPPEAN